MAARRIRAGIRSRMKNFGRALRLALRYRAILASSVFCALMVAVFWCANISVIYPFVEVIFRGKSLQVWVDEKISESEAAISKAEDEIARLEKLPSAERDRNARYEMYRAETTVAAEREAVGLYRRLRPHIHRYLPDGPFRTLVLLVGLLMAGTVIKSLFFIGHQILVNRLTQLTTFNLRKHFYRRTLRMDLASFSEDGANDLMSRFTYDMESLVAGLNTLFGKAVREPLKMVACLIGAALICWPLLLLSLLIAPAAGYLISRLAASLKRANRRAMEEMSQIYGVLEETIRGIKIVKAFTMERAERWRFHRSSKKYYQKAMRIARYDALTKPVTEMMGIMTICLALIVGAYLVLTNETHLFGIPMSDRPLSIAALAAFYAFLAGVSDPARKLSDVFNRLQRAAAAADRIYAMIDREPTVANPPNPRRLARHRRELSLEDVSFHYHPEKPVLREVNLQIGFGESVAIVGPNGCGKSTLMNLIPRFFDPCSGTIRLDGVDLREARLRDLRRQIGIVTQETVLFDDTVYNNIRYGVPWASEDQIFDAAKRAHAHRFIEERLERGYETNVGAGGSSLSGGQRQRIALARAILRDPAILLLDEATSQVDLESEQVIHKVLESFVRHRTTILITHRMSTLALANRIVVMDTGRILDIGTHEELLGRCDLYHRLHDLQFRDIA